MKLWLLLYMEIISIFVLGRQNQSPYTATLSVPQIENIPFTAFSLFQFEATDYSSQCLLELKEYLNHFLGNKSALTLFLNTGKGLNELGNYQGCKAGGGRYYLLTLDIPIPLISQGLCVPNYCQEDNFIPIRKFIFQTVNSFGGINGQNLTIDNVFFHDVQRTNAHNSTIGLGVIIFSILIFLAVGIGFGVRWAPAESVLRCFDTVNNFRCLIFENNKTDPNLDIFNGLRVISMFWIMLGHGFAQIIMTAAVLSFSQFYRNKNNNLL